MPWWGWVLIGWASLATLGGLLLGAVAAKARSRERATSAHRYQRELGDEVRRR